jgi:hypothetical protein
VIQARLQPENEGPRPSPVNPQDQSDFSDFSGRPAKIKVVPSPIAEGQIWDSASGAFGFGQSALVITAKNKSCAERQMSKRIIAVDHDVEPGQCLQAREGPFPSAPISRLKPATSAMQIGGQPALDAFPSQSGAP